MTRLRSTRRTGLATAVLGSAALTVGACGAKPATEQPADLATTVARQQQANALLQRQVELASGKDFYLVLDPGAGSLTLKLGGAELQRFQVLGLQVGRPRVAWFSRHDARPWHDVVWLRGELDPPRQLDRLVIQAPPPRKDAPEPEPPPIPPTPEELYPVPSRYHVRFDEGRSIEIRPQEADAQVGRLTRVRTAWSTKWRDVLAALIRPKRDAVRLRLVLKPADAASLYRSLPPAVRLLVVPSTK